MIFNFHKTMQAVAFFLRRKSGMRDNYMRIIKLLYIAERRSLAERAAEISGDSVFAMERGPVLSRTLDLIKGIDPDSSEWEKSIARDGYEIEIGNDPGTSQLSRAEIKILSAVWDEFRNYGEWELVDWCHEHLPEYQSNWERRGEKKNHPIPLPDILHEVGRSGEDKQIKARSRESAYFSSLFGDHEPSDEGST